MHLRALVPTRIHIYSIKDTMDVTNAINVPIANEPPKTPIKTPTADSREVNLNAPVLEE